jgi:hypothetical protein
MIKSTLLGSGSCDEVLESGLAEQGSWKLTAFGAKLLSILYLHCTSSDNELQPHHASFEGRKGPCKMVCLFYSSVRNFRLTCLSVGTELGRDPDAA